MIENGMIGGDLDAIDSIKNHNSAAELDWQENKLKSEPKTRTYHLPDEMRRIIIFFVFTLLLLFVSLLLIFTPDTCLDRILPTRVDCSRIVTLSNRQNVD